MSEVELFAACVHSARGQVRVTRVRGRDADERTEEIHAWFSDEGSDTPPLRRVDCGAFGELTLASQPLSLDGARGWLVIAAKRPAFPSARELVVLETAATLASVALESAAALYQREAVSKAKREFLAVLGHELRNPLAPIVSALDSMQLRKSGVTSREEVVMRRQVEHLGTLVDDLLDMSRFSRGLLTLQTSQLEIARVIDDAIETTRSLFLARGHELSVRVPSRGLPVDADRARLARALETLLSNAAKYTPPKGHITVEGTLRRHRVRIAVRDNGVGISPELLPRVFDEFVQGRDSSDAHSGGLGVGLSITRALVELHGGTVSASSAGPGQGSQFIVDLPVADADVDSVVGTEELASPGSWAPTRATRIFILDDNVDAAEMLGETLTLAGHQVLVGRDSSLAVAAVDEFQPEFAILDIGMPELNGYDVAKLIRSQLERPPTLIALTGYGQPSDRQRSEQAGFAVHLVKPVDMPTLHRILSSVVPPTRSSRAAAT